MNKIILASNSPRRKALFSLFDWPFFVNPADVDETQLPEEDPKVYVLRLAVEKAQSVAEDYQGLIIAADTIVVDGEELLGKPRDSDDARRMLNKLRGRVHKVYSGVSIVDMMNESSFQVVCCTDVPMREYSKEEIEAYIVTGDPMDKAGAYAIQHEGFHPVEGLAGCYASVMGLPLCHLAVGLKALGFFPPNDIAQRCQHFLGYQCPIFESILG
jgi:MAF protein